MTMQSFAGLSSDVMRATASGHPVLRQPYARLPSTSGYANEFCFFVKPEVMSLPDLKLRRALQIVRQAFDQYGVKIEAQAVVPGRTLRELRNTQALWHYKRGCPLRRRWPACWHGEGSEAGGPGSGSPRRGGRF